MAGTKAGGLKAKEATLAKNPNFYADIGKLGGQKSRGGGFASKTVCNCDAIYEPHRKAQCAGTKGGSISKRGPTKRVHATV